MKPAGSEQVTQLLIEWSGGNKAALDELLPLVYDELHRLARYYMRREDAGHTLQTSALVNEAYMRLVDQRNVRWQNRAHFFGIAAQIMRRILLDHARRRHKAKRGGGDRKIALDEAAVVSGERAAELISLDDALVSLESIDQRKGRIVELRFFGGLNIEETAEVLEISPATVQREWSMAKAWLYLDGGEPKQITDKQAFAAVFSPDGKFMACNYREQVNAPWNIAILPADGGNPVKVFDIPRDNIGRRIRWTPNGRGLTYNDSQEGVSNLWIQPAVGSAPKRLTNFTEGQIRNFAWSHDGKQLVVSRGEFTNDVVLISNFRW